MEILRWLYEAHLQIGKYQLGWMELIGVLLGVASAVLGMYRKMWTWPVGMVANVMLFFVYIQALYDADSHKTPLWGQSGRQVFFLITAVYGWYRWNQVRHRDHRSADAPAITPRWATTRERMSLAAVMVVGVVVVQLAFHQIGNLWPTPDWYYWADAWIFTGSLLATYAMARGWNEFWLVWIAVDLVGVPTLLKNNYVPSAVLYAFYAAFVVYGFIVWLRATRAESRTVEPAEAAQAIPA